jgi:hypothetical protein
MMNCFAKTWVNGRDTYVPRALEQPTTSRLTIIGSRMVHLLRSTKNLNPSIQRISTQESLRTTETLIRALKRSSRLKFEEIWFLVVISIYVCSALAS